MNPICVLDTLHFVSTIHTRGYTMAGTVSNDITPQDNPEEPKSGPECSICGQTLTPSAYQKLIVEGIGGSVLCQTPGCPAVAYLRLSFKGKQLIQFHVRRID